jgi:hypothetical protein
MLLWIIGRFKTFNKAKQNSKPRLYIHNGYIQTYDCRRIEKFGSYFLTLSFDRNKKMVLIKHI